MTDLFIIVLLVQLVIVLCILLLKEQLIMCKHEEDKYEASVHMDEWEDLL